MEATILSALKGANLALAFLLELAVLFAVGVWGFSLGARSGVRYLVGVGAPVVMVVLWSLFGAPGSVVTLHGGVRLGFEILWFGLGAVALWAAGRRPWALALALLWILSTVLVHVWHQHS